jgi:AraC-like DNA-binding protein
LSVAEAANVKSKYVIVKWEGVPFTLKSLARKLGVSYKQLQKEFDGDLIAALQKIDRKRIAKEYNINYHTLSKRLNSGMSLEAALAKPHGGFKE